MFNSCRGSGSRSIAVVLLGLLLAVGVAAVGAATAHAANYRLVLCAGNNGSNSFQTATNTTSSQNPGGIFSFENYCGPAPYPAGNNALLRIVETQSGGGAGVGAYGSISWSVPPWVAILAGGGYTREPGEFNDGWRGRFWAEDWGGGTNNILMQGTHASNSGISWSPTSTFASHLWPFSGYGDYRRFVFELTCFRQAGCDRSGFNAVDANTIVLTLADRQDSQARFTDGSALMRGEWVRGTHAVTWTASDQGSGLRWERLYVDGAERSVRDHRSSCDIDSSGASGEFARRFGPCPTGPYGRSYALATASVPDGARAIRVCAQDYAQAVGLDGTGSQSCDQRTIRVDNTAPGKPAGLRVTSSNPARYLDRFGASFSLPPNQGSPIAKVHYEVLNAAGDAVEPEKVLAATNPTSLAGIEGPERAGAYTLRVWLEDQVGFLGPAAEAPIPHDTTPPAAPQELRVAASTSAHTVERFGLRWANVADAGSPIDAAHYQVLDGLGEVVMATRTANGEDIEAIENLQTPQRVGAYTVRLWLSDAEGNVGAAATVALPRDTTPPAAPQDVSVAAPGRSRAQEGFDVRWRNIVDAGSPIDAAHYQVLSAAGKVLVPTTTVAGRNIEAISDLNAPSDRGAYELRLWLSDAEGNVGAPVSVPLSYACVRSEVGTGTTLSSEVVRGGAPRAVLRQGQGATLRGRLLGARGGGVANAPVCVFSRVASDPGREFLGISLTGTDGTYGFALPAGPSRELSVAYRSGHRELTNRAQVATRVMPFFKVRRKVVRNRRFARFRGRIPGPHNDGVVVVLQVKRGKGWLAFRRYRTRGGGRFAVGYRFNRTTRPTFYVMRAQVRAQSGYPYLQGTSRPLRLVVLPARRKRG
jgi:hypothetical protein